MEYDGWGVTGIFFDYAMMIALSGSTVLLFLYCWKKKGLNFDESAKMAMLMEDEPNDGSHTKRD